MGIGALVETTKCPGTNLFHCHFVHDKFHMTPPEIEPGLRGNCSATKGFNCGTAHRNLSRHTLKRCVVGNVVRERQHSLMSSGSELWP